MSNLLTASKKIMKNYLSELLTEPEVVQELSHQRVDEQKNSKLNNTFNINDFK